MKRKHQISTSYKLPLLTLVRKIHMSVISGGKDPGRHGHWRLPPTLHSIAIEWTALHCTALHCTALHYKELHWAKLHCTALHCTALHCTVLHFFNGCAAPYHWSAYKAFRVSIIYWMERFIFGLPRVALIKCQSIFPLLLGTVKCMAMNKGFWQIHIPLAMFHIWNK